MSSLGLGVVSVNVFPSMICAQMLSCGCREYWWRLDCGEFGARDRVARKIAVLVDGVTEPWAIGTA